MSGRWVLRKHQCEVFLQSCLYENEKYFNFWTVMTNKPQIKCLWSEVYSTIFMCYIYALASVQVCWSDGVRDGELLPNRESEEHAGLCGYLIKDKFIYVHLLKGVILSNTGACHSSKSRCEPPPQSVAPPECLEVPRKRNGSCSMNHGANVNIACYPIRKIKHVNPSFNCWVFCCLNSVWLQAALRQIEL